MINWQRQRESYCHKEGDIGIQEEDQDCSSVEEGLESQGKCNQPTFAWDINPSFFSFCLMFNGTFPIGSRTWDHHLWWWRLQLGKCESSLVYLSPLFWWFYIVLFPCLAPTNRLFSLPSFPFHPCIPLLCSSLYNLTATAQWCWGCCDSYAR